MKVALFQQYHTFQLEDKPTSAACQEEASEERKHGKPQKECWWSSKLCGKLEIMCCCWESKLERKAFVEVTLNNFSE